MPSGAADQDQDVAEALLAARFAGRLEQELHRGPTDRPVPPAVEQVDDHRNEAASNA